MTTESNYIAFDPAGAERADAYASGLYVYVAGFGSTREAALADAYRHLGHVVTGLACGTTDDPRITARSAKVYARVFRARRGEHFRAT